MKIKAKKRGQFMITADIIEDCLKESLEKTVVKKNKSC